MSRLTTRASIMGRKHDIERGQAHHWKRLLKNYDYQLIEEAVDKLGELEDIEDRWGIGLDVLYKALTNRIVYIRKDGIADYCFVEHFVPSMKGQELHTRGRSSMMHDKNFLAAVSTPYKYGETHLGLKDYRKRKPGGWALTPEDFE